MPETHEDEHGLLDGDEPEGGYQPVHEAADAWSWRALSKTLQAMATLVVLVSATFVLPILEWARPWRSGDPVPFWNIVGREILGDTVDDEQTQLGKAEEMARKVARETPPSVPLPPRNVVKPKGDEIPAYVGHPDDALEVVQPLEDPSGVALDGFFAALARTEAGFEGATTRAVHWGDSAIGTDGITGAVRRSLQSRFGDGGHGFHLLQPPNASYRHQDIVFWHNDGWGKCFIIFRCRNDGHYGLGGTTFHSNGGAESRFATTREGAFGRSLSRFEVWFAAAPGGGRLQVKIDDGEARVIDTRADVLEDGFARFDVEDGPHRFSLRAAGGGRVRAYGVVLERENPGVVWDELSLIGSFTNRLLAQDPEHFHSQIARRDPHLAVFMFGGNDMIRSSMTMEDYKREYRDVIRLVRGGKANLACLVMAPLDHGERRGQRIVTREIVPRIVAAQRALAFEEGCAFFDTFLAMGGEGAMGRWFRSSPRLGSGDLSHATAAGQAVIGTMLYRALMRSYVDYRLRDPKDQTGTTGRPAEKANPPRP